jgi:hypothetical protein
MCGDLHDEAERVGSGYRAGQDEDPMGMVTETRPSQVAKTA